MTDPVTLEWDEAATKRLAKVPFFVRKLAQRKIEKAALARGQKKVTVELMEQVKKQEMGR